MKVFNYLLAEENITEITVNIKRTKLKLHLSAYMGLTKVFVTRIQTALYNTL